MDVCPARVSCIGESLSSAPSHFCLEFCIRCGGFTLGGFTSVTQFRWSPPSYVAPVLCAGIWSVHFRSVSRSVRILPALVYLVPCYRRGSYTPSRYMSVTHFRCDHPSYVGLVLLVDMWSGCVSCTPGGIRIVPAHLSLKFWCRRSSFTWRLHIVHIVPLSPI